MFKGISERNIFMVKFQDRCEKDLSSNQLPVVIVENIPVEK